MDPVQQPTSCGAHYFPYVMRAWNREYSPCLPAPLRALARTVEIIFFSVVDFFLIPLRCCQSRNPPEIVDPNEGSGPPLGAPPAAPPEEGDLLPAAPPPAAPPAPPAPDLNLNENPPAAPPQEEPALENQEQPDLVQGQGENALPVDPDLDQELGLNEGPASKQMLPEALIPESIPARESEDVENKGPWASFDKSSLKPAKSVAESSAPASPLTRPERNKIWEGASQRAGSTSEGKEEEGSPSSPSAQSSDEGESSASAGPWKNNALDIPLISPTSKSPSGDASSNEKDQDDFWKCGEGIPIFRCESPISK